MSLSGFLKDFNQIVLQSYNPQKAPAEKYAELLKQTDELRILSAQLSLPDAVKIRFNKCQKK